jgi:DNA-binding CsgD family transcriptional regulator
MSLKDTAPAPATARWPLVGRWQELEQLADALDHGSLAGALIYGPAGVGKTRLADESLERAVAAGRVGGRVAAGTGTGNLSLGALIPLLPGEVVGREFDPSVLYATVAEAFRMQAGDRPYVLVVDDMHRLDPTSAALLGQLLDGNAIFLIGTLRTGEPAPHGLADLWRRDHVLRIDLDDLPPDDVVTLLHLALGGPVAAGTVDTVATLSRGNVLYAREIVIGASVAGNLRQHQGVWQLTGPVPTTARLAELVDARLATAADGAGELLEVLALTAPLGLSEIEATFGSGPLDALDQAGLLEIRADGRRQRVTLAHPLYAEVMRDRISPLTRRRVLLAYAERVNALGARRREDALRVATAHLDGAGSADPSLLQAAARLARYGHDYPQVERLARAALTEDAQPESLLLLAEALHELGAYADADHVLSEHAAVVATAPDRTRLPLVQMRARNLFWGLQRLDDALAVYETAQRDVVDAEFQTELILDQAMALAMCGRPREALQLVAGVEAKTPRARVLRALSEVPALTQVGRCEQARTLAREAYRQHDTLTESVAVAHPGLHVIHEMMALLDAGRFASATKLASAAYPLAIDTHAPAGQVWWAYGLGRAALFSGQLETAKRWFGEAAGLCRDGFYGQHRIVLSLLAAAAATLGDGQTADAAVDEMDALPAFAYHAPEQELGRAWSLVARSDIDGAKSVLVAAAATAAATGASAQEAWLLHELVRLGDPAVARERLEVLSVECEGALVAAYAAHASAAAARSAPGLADALDRFVALGALLLAAEVATEASAAYRRAGDGRQASALLTRASALVSQCDRARTPALFTSADAPEPLTAREREIAALAAQRFASKEIAAQLGLSVRTVDNHLQRIYTKLGVGGRADLADALDYLDDA